MAGLGKFLKARKDHKGFTLVEMMIVIAIVAILATIAIANYGSVRQKAKLDIVADTLVSIIKQQQSNAKNGKGGGVVSPTTAGLGADSGLSGVKCYGLFFQTSQTTDKPYASLVSAPYVAVGTNGADYCDTGSEISQPVTEMEDFSITSLKKDNVETPELEFYFKPPFGKPFLAGAGSSTADLTTVLSSQIDITLSSKTKGDDRLIRFDAASGVVSVIRNNSVTTGVSSVTGSSVTSVGQ